MVSSQRWSQAGQTPPVSNVFQRKSQEQAQRSLRAGSQEQRGQRIRLPPVLSSDRSQVPGGRSLSGSPLKEKSSGYRKKAGTLFFYQTLQAFSRIMGEGGLQPKALANSGELLTAPIVR